MHANHQTTSQADRHLWLLACQIIHASSENTLVRDRSQGCCRWIWQLLQSKRAVRIERMRFTVHDRINTNNSLTCLWVDLPATTPLVRLRGYWFAPRSLNQLKSGASTQTNDRNEEKKLLQRLSVEPRTNLDIKPGRQKLKLLNCWSNNWWSTQ